MAGWLVTEAVSQTASAPSGTPRPLSDITGNHIGRMVTVVGTITNRIPPTNPTSRAPHRWYVTDGKGVVLVVIFPDDYRQLANPDTRFPMNGGIQVRGKLTEYRGQLQLAPSTPGDIEVPAAGSPQGVWGLETGMTTAPAAVSAAAQAVAAPPPPMPASPPDGYIFPGQVNKERMDQTLRVAGMVSAYRASWSERAPNILTLEGGGGTLDLVYWDEIDKALGNRKSAVTTKGRLVKAEGTLSEYRERLQLRIEKADKLESWDVAPGPAAPISSPDGLMKKTEAPESKAAPAAPQPASAPSSAETRTPSQITRDDLGKTFVVTGVVRAVHQPTTDRAPTRVELADDTSALPVVYWTEQASQFTGDAAPVQGEPWKVEATVSEYRGELQLRARGPVK